MLFQSRKLCKLCERGDGVSIDSAASLSDGIDNVIQFFMLGFEEFVVIMELRPQSL